MAKINQAEREFYTKRITGLAATTPFDELKRSYFISRGVGPSQYLSELEIRWLSKVIADNGGAATSDYPSDLWKQINALLGFRVSKYVDENRLTFFLNYTGS